ncbi:MAG: carboxypeptidase-like regulatory domain-containing protein [Rikenellaceae bacterium]
MILRAKLTILLLLAAVMTTFAAESGILKARILDADATTVPVAGAVVELIPSTNPDAKVYYSTDGSGLFTSAQLLYDTYTLNISFLGYESHSQTVTVGKAETTLYDIMLKSSSVQMETVMKETKALRASQKGDTLNYNASSFKVASDSDVEGLLSKMPGISIEDGEVTAQGEEVKKIYVDGREFFGSDVATALKSLPAEIVDRIEVYDKLSDEAEYSGVDDGQGEKTINIVTHQNMRQGVFGKVYAGGGYEPDSNTGDDPGKYMIGGSVNLFNNTSRLSVIGLTNNINQQNFSFEDVMGLSDDSSSSASSFMVKQLPGVATVNAVGLNYSDVFGEDDKLKVQGSYFYNHTKTTNVETKTRWYEGEEATSSIDSLYQVSNTFTDNINHRFNGRIDWEINDKNSLLIRPYFSMQANDPLYDNAGTRYGASYDAGYQDYSNLKDTYWKGFNVGSSANYRLRLGERRNFTLGGSFTINDYNGEGSTTTYPNQPNDDEDSATTYLYEDGPSFKRNLSGNAGYTEPLAKNLILNLTYRLSQNFQSTDKGSYNTDESFTPTLENEITSASSYTSSTYLTHKAGVGVRFVKDKSNLIASAFYQKSDLLTETIDEENGTVRNNPSYTDFVYSLIGQAYFNQQNSLRIYFNTYTNNPALSRIQDIYSIGSSYISKGNPMLEPTYTSSLRFRFINSNIEKGRTFMWMVHGERTNNYIASHIVLCPENLTLDGVDSSDTEDIEQYTTWVNLKDYTSVGTHFDYGLPFDFMKCNLNLKCGITYSITPSIFGGEIQSDGTILGGDETETDKLTYFLGAVLGSNISENVDFTLQWHGKYYEADNSATSAETLTTNKYYDQSASAAMKFVFGGGFTFTASVTYKQYIGITNDYVDQYTVCNAFIGRKIFKSKRGEINVGVNDALNQNTSFSRYIGTNYSQNTTNITMGRYYSAQFVYNLRYFGRDASKNADDYEGMGNYINNTSSKSNNSGHGPGGPR